MSSMRGKLRWPEGPITGDEFAEFLIEHEDDVGHCELVAGRVVPVSPPKLQHSFLQARLTIELGMFCKDCKTCWILTELGVYTQRGPDTVRVPDLGVVSRARLPSFDDKPWLRVTPELLVEVLSSSDRWKSIQKKVAEYQKLGVDYLWLVDPKHRSITEYRGDRIERYLEHDTLEGEGLLQGFSLSLESYFTP